MLLDNGWEIYEPPVVAPISLETQYKQRIVELIRKKYSGDDEFAILRQRDTKTEEFNEYNEYVEECKRVAYNEIYKL